MHVTVLISIVTLDPTNQRRVTYILAVIGQKLFMLQSVLMILKISALEVSEEQKISIKRTLSAQGKTTIIPTL